jgi:FkbM family methyltransferase
LRIAARRVRVGRVSARTVLRFALPGIVADVRRQASLFRRVGMGRAQALRAALSPSMRRAARVVSLPLLPEGLAPLDVAVDVGAYVGEFAEALLRVVGARRLVAFEPDPDAYAAARERLSAWPEAEVRAVAVGARPGTARLRRFRHPTNNSLLPMDPDRDPDPRDDPRRPEHEAVAECDVRVERLDDLLPEAEFPRIGFLKVDVQGGERDVIEGGAQVLRRTDAVLIEAPFRASYAGAGRFPDLHGALESLGFALRDLGNFVHGRRGSLLQADALYVRASPR